MAVEGRAAGRMLLVCALASTGWNCASQVAPAGGPADTEPPRIVSSTPPAGALHVEGAAIRLEFSEYVDRRSFQESVFLSPSPGALRYEWGGKEVEISYPGPLRPNTTYILTVGTDLKDARNNALAASFALPFSTGGKIDSCSASGRVDDQSPGGVMVFAWDVSGGRGDTLNPAASGPDYLTQTGSDGLFVLPYMKEGAYRLMAVRDVFRNLIYNVQTDHYGMAAEDVRLGGGEISIGGIGLRLSSEDTLRPFVSGVKAPDRTSVLVRFNEPVRIEGGAGDVSIVDTADGRPLAIIGIAPADTAGRDFIALTSPQDSGAVYRLVVDGFADGRGNRADPASGGGIFTGAAGNDTTAPAIIASIGRDSVTGVSPLDTIRIGFSEPVDTAAFQPGFSVTGPGSARVAGTLRWRGPTIAEFLPDTPFVTGGWYRLEFRADSARDRSGNTAGDTLTVRRFRIIEEKQLSSISGGVVRGGGSGVSAVVEAVRLPAAGGAFRRVRTDSSGSFDLEMLPEGLYLLSAFVDADGDGVHDRGRPFPARFAEPFGLYPDTLKLRPRWPVEGVRISIGR